MTNEISRNSSKKYIIFPIVVITLVMLLVAGGTYAFLSEDFGATNGNYAYNTACFDIVYDVTNEDGTSDITGTLIPSAAAKRGLTGSVSIGLEEGCKTYAYGDIYLNVTNTDSVLTQTVSAHCENVETLETMSNYTTESDCTSQVNAIWVTDGTALKYAVYKESKDEPISVGYVDSSSQKINIYKEFNVEKQITYDIYIWLDGNLIDETYASKSFGGSISASVTQVERPLSYQEEILNGAGPVLDNGMIPVTISDDGIVTTIKASDSSWYSYENKEWANALLVTDDSRNSYLNTSGVTVNESDILAYYVWIPRYRYQVWTTTKSSTGQEQTINIIFENAEAKMSAGTVVGTYRTHPAFWWDDDSDGVVDVGETIDGIWVGKFETTGSTTKPTIKPNSRSLVTTSVSSSFVASQKFSASGNLYGLSNTSTNAHMMKNSEWGAVAYLSHSAYGINQEVYINNSSNYFTGRSGGAVGGSVNTLVTQFPDDQTATTRYNSYGYYTWLGQKVDSSGNIGDYELNRTLGTYASTTGNVTGLYDMSGGAWEYVMGNYNDTLASSSFEEMPDSKYYDKYEVTSASLCTLATCGGHALYETNAWYSDNTNFVYSSSPWFTRGGNFSFTAGSAGIFNFRAFDSSSGFRSIFRSVLVVGFGK